MQYDVASPAQYLKALESDWRKETLLQLRQIILQQAEPIEESIHYKMLCFTLNGQVLFHLNAQRGYVSLYCGDTQKIDPENQFLGGLNLGKGCIRFSKTKAVTNTQITLFIEQAIRLHKSGASFGC